MRYSLIGLLFPLFWSLTPGLCAAQKRLSPQAQISVLTCAPGQALYSTFGHTAIRIYDPLTADDRVYNYGIFDFDTPGFYLKFIRGQLPYQLGAQKMSRFMREYRYYRRAVQEHRLQLDPAEKQAISDFLIHNYRPENREYQYDFFYDNCASRVVDVIDTVLAGRINWSSIPPAQVSFRHLLDPYLQHRAWDDFGIDLILGLESDRIASFRQQMFLPDYIPQNFTQLSVDRDSLQSPVWSEEQILLDFPREAIATPWWQHPLLVFGLLALFAIASGLVLPRSHRLQKLDYFWFGASGLAGLLFVFMWFATDHEVCHRNLNLLWANPLWLLLLPVLGGRLAKNWERGLLYFNLALLLPVLLALPWLPQELPYPVWLIALLLFFRGIFRLRPNVRA
ncbi:MAG: DUF4105 domain-containing protein [Bacteroidota bacterium]